MEAAVRSANDRPLVGRRKSSQASRVANGSALLTGADHRSAWCRRLKETLQDHLSDIPDASVNERRILRCASHIEVSLEQLETKFALAGEASLEELDSYARISANLRRLLASVGLQRRARQVNSLTQVLDADWRARQTQQREAVHD